MNIPGFALPAPLAYGDLSVLNELGTLNYKVWLFIEMTVEGTQRALFSMLFGAGMILFLASKEGKVSGLMPAEYFFPKAALVAGFWPGKRLHIALVLGHSLYVCHLWNDPFCLSAIECPEFNYCGPDLPGVSNGKRSNDVQSA